MEKIFEIDLIYYEITKTFCLEDIFKLRDVCSTWKNCIENYLSQERFLSIFLDKRFQYTFDSIVAALMNLNSKKITANTLFIENLEQKLKYLPNIDECYIRFGILDEDINEWLKVSRLLTNSNLNLKKIVITLHCEVNSRMVQDSFRALEEFKSLETIIFHSSSYFLSFKCDATMDFLNCVSHLHIERSCLFETENFNNLKSISCRPDFGAMYDYIHSRANYIQIRTFASRYNIETFKTDQWDDEWVYEIISRNYLDEYFDFNSFEDDNIVSIFFLLKNNFILIFLNFVIA